MLSLIDRTDLNPAKENAVFSNFDNKNEGIWENELEWNSSARAVQRGQHALGISGPQKTLYSYTFNHVETSKITKQSWAIEIVCDGMKKKGKHPVNGKKERKDSK